MRDQAQILADLDKKRKEADKLSADLRKSLAIQAVWPEAYAAGKCTLRFRWTGARMGVRMHRGKLDAHLIRPDGVRFELTVEQFDRIKGTM